ncbi:carboxylase propionyl-CoA carboxylase [Nitzschia inconspicua]|uniref:propionyl-CoA carboxylase n=1 Tax=Nitzschia inconspicua TaxID=303405 RepID=A0A9K3L2W9_9STRA|nr:carboxylase propionyl-CoA carboxylase [Nitzschia inconspicua]
MWKTRQLLSQSRTAPSPSVLARLTKSRPASAIKTFNRFLSTSQRPFDKVLIANRGEISQRVARTCKDLGIKTVAIYSTADAKAPFVQAADEAICVGPAASSESYLNVPKVLQAIRTTNAKAVHPGYGFLSENSEFCRSIESEGVAWLGPPVSAIRDMGDKIRSKEIAEAAGVSIIPGYDGEIESLEHAIQVSNDIGYPVLVKAAAGGGGKGMRTCYNDQEVKEAYPMAKSEAMKFFADDRLLVEKYIENPHHIEFQVLCSPPPGVTTCEKPEDLQVVVFPERECSIQRRNQKVVEESPSCLLTEETRLKMVEQVKRLCQKVGYQSAGTVEWLVDEKQNFYFLEMNTRLQVEHPITEAVTGVDLVKGMLWVGAKMGLPPELQIEGTLMPYKGHAIEARIYAEDPVRGYLPSTGPLVPYKEPVALGKGESYLRLDSGVIEGHVVSPFYDPMLSKIIAYAPTRDEAIDILADGLDNYVIEGVQHNARLVNAVLRHPVFRSGNTPTSFLPNHIPKFEGVQLTPSQEEELAVAIALISKERESTLQRPPVSSTQDGGVVVRLGGLFGKGFSVKFDESSNMAVVAELSEEGTSSERQVAVDNLILDPENCVAHVSLDGANRAIQVIKEQVSGELKVQMYGADMECLVQSPREYELSAFMHPPVIEDTSNVVMSPMPGTLISFAVQEGDHVEVGQELCIVEAMKMQNIVRAPREGYIGKLNVKQGAALVTDQVLVEFAVEAEEEAA